MFRGNISKFFHYAPKNTTLGVGTNSYALARSQMPLKFSAYGPGIPVQRQLQILEGAGYSAGQTLLPVSLLGNGNVAAQSVTMQALEMTQAAAAQNGTLSTSV